MKKRMRLLAAVSVLAFLLSACGTPLYVMTDEEEELIVQGAAYLVSKHNIYQKDGMNAAQPEQETEEETETQQDSESDSQETDDSDLTGSGSENSGGETQTASGGTISLAEAIGYGDKLEVTYDGYSLMDVYQEGSYFSLDADDGDTFIVMEFTIHNSGGKDVTIDNFDAGYEFYCSFGNVSQVSEKRSFITDSLSAFEGTVAAGGQASAVLVFEITKDQAEQIDDLTLTMEKDNTSYSVQL